MFSVLLLKFLKIQMKKSEDHIEIKFKICFKIHTKHYFKNHVILYIIRVKYWERVQPRANGIVSGQQDFVYLWL